jgi:hypothetical protein
VSRIDAGGDVGRGPKLGNTSLIACVNEYRDCDADLDVHSNCRSTSSICRFAPGARHGNDWITAHAVGPIWVAWMRRAGRCKEGRPASCAERTMFAPGNRQPIRGGSQPEGSGEAMARESAGVAGMAIKATLSVKAFTYIARLQEDNEGVRSIHE